MAMQPVIRIAVLAAAIVIGVAAEPGVAETPASQAVAPAEIGGKSYAVVVGIGHYRSAKWPTLRYARKDAEGMVAVLRVQGFEVIPLYDQQATGKSILRALEEKLAPRLRENDRILFFFSGHGYTQHLAGRDFGYLVPYDGGDGAGSLLSMELLQSLSEKMGAAKHQLFIMDACFGGLFAPTKSAFVGVNPSRPVYIREITRRVSRQFLTAGGKDQQVLDGGPEGFSYFTGFLISALRDGLGDLDGDGYITMAELTTYLVPRATNAYQTPGTGSLPGHGLGEFVFTSPGHRTAAVAVAPRPDTAALGIKGAAKAPPPVRSMQPASPEAARPAPVATLTPPDIAKLPTASALADRGRLERLLNDDENEVRAAIGDFLRQHYNIPEISFHVQAVWKSAIVRSEQRGFVIRLNYEVAYGDRERNLREDEFVVRAENNGVLRVIDQLTAWN